MMASYVRVEENTLISLDRKLPTTGKVLVKVGEIVEPETLIAEGVVENPDIHEVKIFAKLGVEPDTARNYMIKQEGDDVKKDEAIATYRSFFSRSTKVARSPIRGKIEAFSKYTGRTLIRGHPLEIKVNAFIPGEIVEVFPKEGARVETMGDFFEGMFGVGGESWGKITLPVNSNESPLTSDEINEAMKGRIIVGGSVVTLNAIRKAVKVGAKGLIVGGLDQKDLTEFLGYEIGLGVTGNEDIGQSIIITEGFGINPMNPIMFELLKKSRDNLACINGSTQIRSRMQRPVIIIPK